MINLETTISGCKSGQRSAQEALYRHFYGYGMTICMGYAHTRFEAEEMVNDGFMKVFKNIANYDINQPIEGWLRRIMVNTAIDHYRSQKKHYAALELNEAAAETDQDITILDKMAAEDIMHHVQQLSPAYRIVFTLYTIEGYKHHEIAKELNISEGASKSNLSKARAKLQTAILNTENVN